MSIFSGVNNPGVELNQFTDAEHDALLALAGLGDPGADRIVFWDESANTYAYLTAGSGLTISDTTISVSAGTVTYIATFALFESTTSVSTGDGRIAFAAPSNLDSSDITYAIATVHTKGITGTTDVQVRRRRAGSDADVLSTKITIGDEFFAADGVINAANDDINTGDQIYIDVDAVHSGTAPLGLTVALIFT